jgi:group I intron endonuclease
VVIKNNIMAFVYKITNNITNKSYIGWTNKPVDNRWKQHKFYAFNKISNNKFPNAIKKYGVDCWDVITLIEVDSKDTAKKLEIEFIEKYDTYHNGYNSTKGGDGNNCIIMSEESNIKRSLTLKGIAKPINFNVGRIHSETTKQKMSNKHLGMKKPWVKWSDEQIKKRAMTRRTLTKEQYDIMIALRNTGMTTKNIASQIGVSNDIVKKWIHKAW